MTGEIIPESFFEESVILIDKFASSEEPPSNRLTGGEWKHMWI
ncbi:hypothetical protein [Jeotgalibaca sp. MA1X17-3]|nr:hypothetical protein [Jeotgalibaca sp. MA1X17-3]